MIMNDIKHLFNTSHRHALRLLCMAVLLLSLPAKAANAKSDHATDGNQAHDDATCQRMQAAVDKFAFHPSLRHGTVGVCVMRIDSGNVVAAHTPDESCITASTMKTVTSATALEVLGKDFTFGTKVLAVGKIDSHGTLKGNIVVQGGGDPTLGSKYFPDRTSLADTLASVLSGAGIKKIDGRIIADISAIPYPPAPNCWMFDDLGYDYGAACFGVCFADNVVTVSFDRSGEVPVDVSVSPISNPLLINNRVRIYDTEEPLPTGYVEAVVDYDTPALNLWGDTRRSDSRFEQVFANPAPYHTLEDSLLRGIRHAGIKVRDKRIADDRLSPDTLLLVDYRSPMLPDVLSSLLYRSDNMFTEMTLRALATAAGKPATVKNGVDCVTGFWKNRGIDCSPLFMRDGSGLSRNNKASARFFCEMLRAVYADRYNLCSDFSQLLPVGGVSGTLRSLLGKTPLKGRVALKSGSMSDVQCFTGYFPADKPEYTVTVLVNNFLCPRQELRRNIECLFVELFDAK